MGSEGQSLACRGVDLIGLAIRCFVAPAKYSSKYFLIQTPVSVLQVSTEVCFTLLRGRVERPPNVSTILLSIGMQGFNACLFPD